MVYQIPYCIPSPTRHKKGIAVDQSREKKMHEPITGVMTRCPITVDPETPFSRVLEQYSCQSDHPLIVVNPDGTLAGVITSRDLISVLIPGDGTGGRYLISELDRILKSTAQNAGDLISDEPLTVSDTAKIRDALLAMEHGYSSQVIVINNKNEPVGCIGLADIIAFLIST